MLEAMRRGQRWLTAIFVALIGGVFVFFIGLGAPLQSAGPSGNLVVEVGDVRMSPSDFQRVRSQQAESYRQQLGDQFSSRAAGAFLDSQALRILVERAVLAHEAEALGLRVGREEIQDVIRKSVGFRDEDGRFNDEGFRNYVEYEFGSQRNYLDYMRRSLLARKMAQVLFTQGQVSEGEAESAARHRLEQVRIAFVALDTESLPPELAAELVGDDTVDAYSAAHEDELRAAYEARLDDYGTPEQIRISHILIDVPTELGADEGEEVLEAAEDAARGAALALLERLRAGEDFATLARELSDDADSKEAGGDLGLVIRSDLTEELAEAAASLEPGALEGPIQSERGFHVVRLEERVPAGTRPFEDVRLELARIGAEKEAARERADATADRLATAIREGKSLEEAASDEDVIVERTGLVRRRADGFVPGLGGSTELLATAFALDEESPSSPQIFSLEGKRTLIQLLERVEPEPQLLAETALSEREGLANQKRNAFLQGWIDTRREELAESGDLLVNSSVVQGS